ncbi:MAG: DedA family protein [Actinomycetales bacterium]
MPALPLPLTTALATAMLIGPAWMDPEVLISFFGTWALPGVALVVFIETGLLFPILPGDSLLFTVGLMTTSGAISTPLWLVCLVLFLAAFLGDQTGYGIGRFAGPKIFNRPDSRLFKQSHIDQTYAFFDKYGGRAIVLGRFVPIVRTYIPVAAGIGRMPYRHFVSYNVVGALAWGVGVTLLGAGLGSFTFVREHIELILLVIVGVSVLPVVVEVLRARVAKRNENYDEEHERQEVIDKIVEPDS